MTIKELAVLTAIMLTLAACKKDEDPPTPTPAATTAEVKLALTFVNGATTFDPSAPFIDAHGRSVHITKLRFFLYGTVATNDEGDTVADLRDKILLADVLAASNTFTLGSMAPGHVHQVGLSLGLDESSSYGFPDQTTAPAPLNDVDMTWSWNVAMGRIFVKLEGFVDTNGNNIMDGDEGFQYHGIGPDMVPVQWSGLHHADVVAGTPWTIGLQLDVNTLVSELGLAGMYHNDDAEVQDLMQRLQAAITLH